MPLLLLVAVALIVSACDPCIGASTCGESWIRYEGDLRQPYTQVPIVGARVVFQRTSGIALEADTAAGVTNQNGTFRIAVRARGEGYVEGQLQISLPGTGVVDRIPNVRLTTTTAAGEVRHVGDWTIPRFSVGEHGELRWRGSGELAPGVTVEFRRTGGVALVPDRFMATTDVLGIFSFLTFPQSAGTVTGDLHIRHLPPYREEVLTNVTLEAKQRSVFERRAGVWWIGPHLPYVVVLVWQDTGVIAAGVEVEFQRTGGVPTEPESVVMYSTDNPWGNVRLAPLQPLGHGEVEGRLIVRPPAPYKSFTIEDIRLPTKEEDVASFLLIARWEIPRSTD
jgi:hypothetical protein